MMEENGIGEKTNSSESGRMERGSIQLDDTWFGTHEEGQQLVALVMSLKDKDKKRIVRFYSKVMRMIHSLDQHDTYNHYILNLVLEDRYLYILNTDWAPKVKNLLKFSIRHQVMRIKEMNGD